MFLKITRSGPRQYLQLVEAFRDDAGKAKHRTLVTLGRLDQLTDSLDSVISGLLKVTGRPDFLNAPLPAVDFESARALGNVWALNELWESLGFGELRRVFKKTRHSIDIEALIRVMVFNRLCDPESKLGVLRWLDTVAMPGVEVESITHQHLLRSMDALVDHQTEVDAVVALSAGRPLHRDRTQGEATPSEGGRWLAEVGELADAKAHLVRLLGAKLSSVSFIRTNCLISGTAPALRWTICRLSGTIPTRPLLFYWAFWN